jgi:DNA-binding CsgD family transcriptional regulator
MSERLVLLTTRERDILRLLQKGHPNKVIAAQLGIAVGTIKVHLHKMFRKLECRNRSHLICITGLVDPHTLPARRSIQPRKQRTKDARPRPHTKLGVLYDLFKAQPGIIIECTMQQLFPDDHKSAISARVVRLRTDYGLDIRRLPHKRWCLVGEWIGDIYIDYTEQRYGLPQQQPGD